MSRIFQKNISSIFAIVKRFQAFKVGKNFIYRGSHYLMIILHVFGARSDHSAGIAWRKPNKARVKISVT